MNLPNTSDYFIGKIVIAKTPFYDVRAKRMKIKARPMLIIGAEKEYLPCDYNVLPVSRVTKRRHRDEVYDIELSDEQCDKLSLDHRPSFIRTHKQTVVNSRDIDINPISDCKHLDNELYEKVKTTHNSYSKTLF